MVHGNQDNLHAIYRQSKVMTHIKHNDEDKVLHVLDLAIIHVNAHIQSQDVCCDKVYR